MYTTFVVYTNVEQSSETPNKIYIFFGKYFFKQKPTTEKMDRKQASTALQNAVAFLKGQKIIKKEIEISTETGFSKGSGVRNTFTGLYTEFGK